MENVERGSIASFGSGNTTDSDHLRGEKVSFFLEVALRGPTINDASTEGRPDRREGGIQSRNGNLKQFSGCSGRPSLGSLSYD